MARATATAKATPIKSKTAGEPLGKTKSGNDIVGLLIPPPNLRLAQFKCVGTAPFVQNKFNHKIMQQMKEKQEAGSTAGSKKGKRDPKDFLALYEGAKHLSEQGWCGIPAGAFRAGLISACRLVNFKMTLAKLSIFIVADGLDATEGTPLVRIVGTPEPFEAAVRNATGVVDIRVRPMWRRWHCILNVRFDADQFTPTDVLNLLSRVGAQVGVGEGRPDSKDSIGMGWGTFEVESAGESTKRGAGGRLRTVGPG